MGGAPDELTRSWQTLLVGHFQRSVFECPAVVALVSVPASDVLMGATFHTHASDASVPIPIPYKHCKRVAYVATPFFSVPFIWHRFPTEPPKPCAIKFSYPRQGTDCGYSTYPTGIFPPELTHTLRSPVPIPSIPASLISAV